MIRLKSLLMSLAAVFLTLGLTSCDDNIIYEKEGDCTPKVQFVFKKHRQALHSVAGREADVFYSTVSSVHLFVFNKETDELVLEKIEKTENLHSASDLKIGSGTDKCYLPLDVKPGTYRLIAWCGLDETDHNNAFNLEDATRAGKYTHMQFKRDEATNHPVHHAKYESVYHGAVEAVITVNSDGTQIIPVELTKDNNDIAVWVQHTTQTFEDGEYEVVYVDANGVVKFDDNALDDDSRLEYHAHTTSLLDSETEFNGDKVKSGALVAHLSTSRLMAGNQHDARLEVRHNDGRVVYSIPFIKYVLQMQTFTDNHQYYLDCEDTYNCSFYLTGEKSEDGLWVPSRIIINNWVIVPSQNGKL